MAGGVSTFRYRHDFGCMASDAMVLSAGEALAPRRVALPARGTRQDGFLDPHADKIARVDAAGHRPVDDRFPAPHLSLGHRTGDRTARGAPVDRSPGHRRSEEGELSS